MQCHVGNDDVDYSNENEHRNLWSVFHSFKIWNDNTFYTNNCEVWKLLSPKSTKKLVSHPSFLFEVYWGKWHTPYSGRFSTGLGPQPVPKFQEYRLRDATELWKKNKGKCWYGKMCLLLFYSTMGDCNQKLNSECLCTALNMHFKQSKSKAHLSCVFFWTNLFEDISQCIMNGSRYLSWWLLVTIRYLQGR